MRMIAFSLCVLFLVAAQNTWAISTILDASEQMIVSQDGDRNNVGSVNAGSLASSDQIARERADVTQQGLRIATFQKYDLSGITGPLNKVLLEGTFVARLNTINNLAIEVGRVDDDGVNGDSWDDSLAAGTVPLFEWGINSADQRVLLGNVRTAALPSSVSVDVTDIVNAWLSGAEANNGFAIYGASAVFQGAGFDGLRLNIIPEPTAATLGLMGLGALAMRRRRSA